MFYDEASLLLLPVGRSVCPVISCGLKCDLIRGLMRGLMRGLVCGLMRGLICGLPEARSHPSFSLVLIIIVTRFYHLQSVLCFHCCPYDNFLVINLYLITCLL